MKSQITRIFGALALISFHCQAEDLSLDNLRLQGSPALALSGTSPSEISQPTGFRQFGLSLLGGASGTDFAFETKPYWWGDPTVEPSQFAATHGWDVVRQSFSLSGARYEFELPGGGDASGVSLGLAFDLVRGKHSQEFLDARDAFLKQRNKTRLDNLGGVTGGVGGVLGALDAGVAGNTGLQSAADNVVSMLGKNRVGWAVSFAAAASFEFSDTEYSDPELAKYGAWVVASYTPEVSGNQFTFLGLGRVLRDESGMEDDFFFDAGARAIWTSANEDIPLSVSAEIIQRFADSDGDSQRWSLVAEYAFSEDIALFLTHGSNFADDARDDEIFTFAGISFGAGKAPKIGGGSQ